MKDNRIRLQKFLAENGVASRRKSEELIGLGKVKVNGRVASIGDKIDPIRDKITVMGKTVVASKEKVYIMLHKPRGFVTTMSDELDRSIRDVIMPLVLDNGKILRCDRPGMPSVDCLTEDPTTSKKIFNYYIVAVLSHQA